MSPRSDPGTVIVESDLGDSLDTRLSAIPGATRVIVIQSDFCASNERRASDLDSSRLVFCVWSHHARESIEARYPEATVFVTGAPGTGSDFAARSPHDSPPVIDSSGPVVIVDDPEDSAWRQDAARIASRLHDLSAGPVTIVSTMPQYWTALGHRAVEPGPDGDELEAVLLVVSPRRKDLLRTIGRSAPLLIFESDACRGVAIKHHLLGFVSSVDAAVERVIRARAEGLFIGDPVGDLLERHALPEVPGMVDEVLHGSIPRQQPRREPAARKLTVAAVNFGRSSGIAIPIMTLCSWLVANGLADVRYVDARAFSRDVLDPWLDSSPLIVNGLETLTRSSSLRRSLRRRIRRGLPTWVYVHSTEAGIARERHYRAAELRAALRLLRRCIPLWVSRRQPGLFATYGVTGGTVVLNTSPSASVHHRRGEPRQGSPESYVQISMVGTLQPRKGFELFGDVADRASGTYPWRFSWAGSPRDGEAPQVLSPAVEWLGRLTPAEVGELLSRTDVFFLASKDDPMPLAVIEAIASGTRVVAHVATGAHELLDGNRGYDGFETYDAANALESIRRVLRQEPDPHRWREIVSMFSIEAFAERMRSALGIETWSDPVPIPRLTPSAQQPPAFIEHSVVAAAPGPWRPLLRELSLRHASHPHHRLMLAEALLEKGHLREVEDEVLHAGIRIDGPATTESLSRAIHLGRRRTFRRRVASALRRIAAG